MLKTNNQNTNTPLQWETAFLLTLVMFPLVGIGPIVAFTVGYFFRRRDWGTSLMLLSHFVLGFQLLIFVYSFLFSAVFERNYLILLFIFPVIGLLIGHLKANRHWAFYLKLSSIAYILVVGYISAFVIIETSIKYSDNFITFFSAILLGFPVIFVSLCIYRYRSKISASLIMTGIILFVLSIIAVAAIVPKVKHSRYMNKCMKTKLNIHQICAGLSKHIEDNPNFPESIQIILDNKHLRRMPTNAFTGKPMRDVEFGSDDYSGNFTYLKHIVDGKVNSYHLFCYGGDSEPGLDINEDGVDDHVLYGLYDIYPGLHGKADFHIIEDPVTGEERYVELEPAVEPIPMPDLKDLLNETYNNENK